MSYQKPMNPQRLDEPVYDQLTSQKRKLKRSAPLVFSSKPRQKSK